MEQEKLLELRRELLNAIDNKSNDKKDLINIIEEVSNKLLQLYHGRLSGEKGPELQIVTIERLFDNTGIEDLVAF